MAFTLDNVVPWGRTLDEYVAMFDLSDADLQKNILGCSDGPASFNASLTQQNGRIISVDPIYQFTPDQIQNRFDQAYETVMSQVTANQSEFVWGHIPNVAALGEKRTEAMNLFIADFEAGQATGRYRHAELPTLPFSDKQFDLALCSHFLFLYSQQFSAEFHLASIQELCRVAHEIRIFPLLQLGSTPSPHVPFIVDQLQREGHTAEIIPVPYEFQRGGNQMLKIETKK